MKETITTLPPELRDHSALTQIDSWSGNTHTHFNVVCDEGGSIEMWERTIGLRGPGEIRQIAGIVGFAPASDFNASETLESRLASLNNFTRRLLDATELSEMLEAGMDMIEGVLGVRRIGIWRVDRARDELALVAERDQTGYGLRTGYRIATADVLKTFPLLFQGQPQLVDDLEAEDPPEGWTIAYSEAGIRSMISVPMHSANDFLELLRFGCLSPDRTQQRLFICCIRLPVT